MTGLTDAVGRATSRAASYAAICILSVCTGTLAANAETRSLKFYHLHTHEKEEITYKRNGRYLPDGLKKINWILRDWRQKKPVNMDPRLLDLVWEAYRQSGSSSYIQVICGYRSSDTNGMLRSRTAGVAKESQHVLGKALDFTLPDVPLAKLRAIGLKMQVGGVGFYPKSGSPFVHFDVGNVRHWPKMSRKELMAVFPNGNTLHVPSDGKPLPGYEQALASYKSRKSGDSIQIANVSEGSGGSSSGKSLLARLFGGGGADEEEDNAEATVAPTRASPAQQIMKPAASPRKAVEEPVVVAAAAPTPKRDVLPNGVPLPIRDTFDTTAPKSPVPPAALTGEAKPEPVQVAALDISRVPLPSAAPVRESSVIAQAMKVPVPTAPVAPDSETVLAALASAPAEDVAAKDGQLAYSVPTPRSRPPFASVLRDIPVPAAPSVAELAAPAVETAAPIATSLASAAIATAQTHAVATLAREAAPPHSASARRAADDKVLLASLAPAKRNPAPVAVKLPVPEGKTGRFKRDINAATGTSAARVVQQAISDKVRMADLVTDPNARHEVRAMIHPNASSLVRNTPTSVLATGFTSDPITSYSTDRFAGSAVNFMPMIKVD
ncbi:DUF882 domain-containing protein [Aureimonas psammosilenae]|uniref:DUF882 domain-containing protein n=1 Tax=Aureimonas psammosilenae TaxID=2495496 RepID=UPI0012610C0C|nr:DUF882 domain-containing protein [Aureimonas psammosilenae]